MKPELDKREKLLAEWIKGIVGDVTLIPLVNDASARRYYRIADGERTIIAMDAPAPESVRDFVDMAERFADAGLRTPAVHAFEENLGFCLLEDLGDELLCSHPADSGAYRQAWQSLLRLQRDVDSSRLPSFDRAFMARELELFPQWYCAEFKSRPLTAGEADAYRQVCEYLIEALLGQAQVAMHRDYHSRNLLVVADGIAIIDFQGAVRGPITYDPASFGNDLYASIEPDAENEMLARFHADSIREGLPVAKDLGEYRRLYDCAAIQRLTKILGLFVRVNQQLDKPHFLDYLPGCAQTLQAIASRYQELQPLAEMIEIRQ
ncbi:MAG: phosphotransferase [Betaproteobacteria bacterium]|nr:phosphotransferase [Betaproteobacteria bacterium]